MLVNAKKNPVKGFSLVELSVVIAVIGILATLTIPQLQKWVMRAKRAEVKGNLINLYACERAIKDQFGFYVARFSCLGFAPQGRLRYRVGFTFDINAATKPPELNNCLTAVGPPGDSVNTETFCMGVDINCVEEPEAIFPINPNGYVFTNNAFTAFGKASLYRADINDADTWQINQVKNLSLVNDEID